MSNTTKHLNDALNGSGSGGGFGGGLSKQTFDATAGQTVFNLDPEVNIAHTLVTRNGHILDNTDYTLTVSTLTLNVGADLNDDITILDFANGNVLAGGGIASNQTILATTPGQTVFTLTTQPIEPSLSFVYLLGHLLEPTEYTLTSTQLTLNTGVEATGDAVTILEFGTGTGGTTIVNGAGDSLTEEHTQASHGFVVGDVLKKISALASKAQADTTANAEPIFGIVSGVTDANTVDVVTHGLVSLGAHGLSLGKMVYLSQVSLGKLTTTTPLSGVYKAIGYVASSTKVYVRPGDTVELSGNDTLRTYQEFSFSGDGSSVNFDLPIDVANADTVLVVVGGVPQPSSSYSIIGDGSGNPRRLQFSEAPGVDFEIWVRYLGVLEEVSVSAPVASTDYNSGTPVPLATTPQTTLDNLDPAGNFVFAHGLGVKPKDVSVVLRCLTADQNYAVGDEIPIDSIDTNSSPNPNLANVAIDSTNISVIFNRGAGVNPIIYDKVSGAATNFGLEKWGVVVYANKEMAGSSGVIQAVNTPATEFESTPVTLSTTSGNPTNLIKANSNFIFAHGLSQKPKNVRVVFVCQSTDLGYSVGDEVDGASFVHEDAAASEYPVYTLASDSTNIQITFNKDAGAAILLAEKGLDQSNLNSRVDLSKWAVKVYANSELGGYKGDRGPAGTGKIAQVKTSSTTQAISTTAVIPYDDSIPLNSEGTEFMSLEFTPKNPDSNLILEWDLEANNVYVVSLFVDNQVNAIQARNYDDVGAIHGKLVIPANGTNTRTYKLRFGVYSGTGWINGNQAFGTRVFGGASQSSLTVTEILP